MTDESLSSSSAGVAALLTQARDAAVKYLESLPERPVFPAPSFEAIRNLYGGALPETGRPAAEVVRDLAAAGEASVVASAGPRYFGYVIGGSIPAALAADWLTSTWDQNAGLWSATPAASAVEEVVVRWILDLLGLPPASGVGIVTGCQMANFTCLAAARHGVLRRAGWNVEADGLAGAPRIQVVAGAEAHVTIHGALRMLGLGTSSIISVPSDAQGRMVAGELVKTLAGLEGPVIVCAQAGNVNTGSFDPIEEIVRAAETKKAWVHVDGAFGLWAAASPKRKHLLRGIAGADSWATDAHKWLNVPYDSGIAIVKSAEDHFGAMSLKADYIEKSVNESREPLDWVPEFSRRGRGFALWAAIRNLGRSGIAEMIDRGADLAKFAAEKLSKEAGVEILAEIVLNQALIRFHGKNAEKDDELTREVVRRVQEDRVCWLSGTRWQGKEAMRFSVCNWSTTEKDVERSVESILKCYRAARG